MDNNPKESHSQSRHRRKVEKEIRARFRKLFSLDLEIFFALKRLRESVNLALYGDPYGRPPEMKSVRKTRR